MWHPPTTIPDKITDKRFLFSIFKKFKLAKQLAPFILYFSNIYCIEKLFYPIHLCFFWNTAQLQMRLHLQTSTLTTNNHFWVRHKHLTKLNTDFRERDLWKVALLEKRKSSENSNLEGRKCACVCFIICTTTYTNVSEVTQETSSK